jgi:hypothetical protein
MHAFTWDVWIICWECFNCVGLLKRAYTLSMEGN